MVARRRRVLRGYTDLTLIRSGALGTLYRAFDIETSKWVAMRLIPAGTVETYVLDELTAEVNALQPVSHHPNLATVHRLLRRRDGSVALVTELCRGSVPDLLGREGVVPVADVVRAARQAAAGLEALHAVGLTHRDVRPSKLLVSRSGATVLEGAGLAVLRTATRTPSTPVSPHDAPEIFDGKAPSPATDVYGLASTMYQLIRGRPAFGAFEGESPASLILRIVGDPAPALRREGVPLALSDLIAKAMSKDPRDRPSTAADFADQLMSVDLPGPIVHEIPAPIGEQPGRADPVPPTPAAPAGNPSPPVRNVLTPLTSGRGVPPVSVRRFGGPTPGPRPVGPEFTDPELPPGDRVSMQAAPGGHDDPRIVRGTPHQPPAGPGPGRGEPAVGPLAWLLLGLAAVVVVLAVIVVTGVL